MSDRLIGALFELPRNGFIWPWFFVLNWPAFARKVFVILFPITVPMWLAAIPLVAVLQLLLLLASTLILVLASVWKGER